MRKEDGELLGQMAKSLEEAGDVLEKSYKNGDSLRFNQAKKIILQMQNKISEMIG